MRKFGQLFKKKEQEKRLVEWDFQCVNNSDFQITTFMDIEKSLFIEAFIKGMNVFNKGRKKIDMDDLEEGLTFPVPEDYFNKVKSLLNPLLKDICDQVKQDGIQVVSWYIKSGTYTTRATTIRMDLVIEGLYDRQRKWY